MVEYVGIPYSESSGTPSSRAVISLHRALHIVHLEALKLGLSPGARARPHDGNRLVVGLGLSARSSSWR